MSTLFGGSPKPTDPPPVPTLSQAQKDANSAQASMLRAGATGQQQTVLTQGLTQPTVQRGSTVLGGLGGQSNQGNSY